MSTPDPQLRVAALDVAGRLVAAINLDPPGDLQDLEEITLGLAERFTYWLDTGRRRPAGPR